MNKPKYLSVSKRGGTRTVALGSYLPKAWVLVRVVKIADEDGVVVLRMENAK